jgi:hypothetical protein
MDVGRFGSVLDKSRIGSSDKSSRNVLGSFPGQSV